MLPKMLLIAPIAGLAATLIGCASTSPSEELVDARAAYEKAQYGPAKAHNPAGLSDAHQALERAERAHREDAQSQKEKDFAYIAERKAKTATAVGQARLAKAERANAKAEYTETLEVRVDAATDQRDAAQDALAQERAARQSAEARAKKALQSLKEVAEVQEDTRGMKITLSGSVVFKTNSADLLPVAEERLRQVADALEGYPGEQIIVAGHTDSRGSESYNEKLSRERAESVREYLISQGVEPDRIRAVGMGEGDPIASNKTAEGRANNRRVEITVGNPENS